MESNIARILLNTKDDSNKHHKAFPSLCQFDLSMMIDMFPGPAVLVDGRMNVHHYNIFGKSLLGPINDKESSLKSMISRCLLNNCPDTQKATIDNSDGLRHYDLYAFPMNDGSANRPDLVFVFGKETTIEHNLTNALVDSRQMFKDLVSCSTDFAWETDSKGNFIYVSPRGILGYTAYELNGKNSHEMIIGGNEDNPFDTMDKVTDMELWLKRSDGSMSCLLVSAVPVFDNRARWQGARGVCRDITHLREREATLRRTQKREHVLTKIVATIRDMTAPEDMLENTLTATLEGIAADGCGIIQKVTGQDNQLTAVIKHQKGISLEKNVIDQICQEAIKFWRQDSSKGHAIETLITGQYTILIGITNHHNIDNGAFFLIRSNKNGRPKNTPWPENEKHLFNGITSHLGIALEQISTHEVLEKLASTDDLTGLLNRRAFRQNVSKRILHQNRSRKTAALLYIDLDNFKNVNDSKGHAVGDSILVELSDIIGETIRVGDYAARMGGDEFAVWLDDISEQDAQLKARNFVESAARLASIANVLGPQPSLSIGIALCDPEYPQTLEELMDHADHALYQAKSGGKATYIVYQPDHHNINAQ